jgi:hypothetical protein
MAKSASNTASPAVKPVTLTALDAARLAMKDVKARSIDTINAAGKTVAVNVNDPAVWQEMGAQAAMRDSADAAALAIARALLKDAPAPFWNAFSTCFIAGAALTHKNPANLLHRLIYAPLKAEGIVKPVSETSSNARPAVKAAKDAKAQAAEALAKLSDADVAKEIADGKSTRMAELFAEMSKREKVKVKAQADGIKKQKAAIRKSLTDAIDLLTPAQCAVLFGFANAILATEKNATALVQHCLKVADAYENSNKKGSKKTKH